MISIFVNVDNIQIWTYDEGNMAFYGSEATIFMSQSQVNIVAKDP